MAFLAPLLQVEHVFSCEIEPFKQGYIERNFAPPILFRDIRELGNKQVRLWGPGRSPSPPFPPHPPAFPHSVAELLLVAL